MAIKSVAFPLLSGGALLIGYAVVARLRSKPRRLPANTEPNQAQAEPSLGEQSVNAPELLVLNLSSSGAPEEDEAHSARASHIRALFLARLTEALSPFHNPALHGRVPQ